MYSDYPQGCWIVADPVPSATCLFEFSLPDDHSYLIQISCLSFVYHSIMYCRNICFSLVVQYCFSDTYGKKKKDLCSHDCGKPVSVCTLHGLRLRLFIGSSSDWLLVAEASSWLEV